MVGGYLAAGGANAINHYIDRDIDGRMRRTTEPAPWRPVASRRRGRWPSASRWRPQRPGARAGRQLAGRRRSPCSAWPSTSGVYTLWLKRTSVHNIVIGGSAGAVPPLVGWAAVTGDLEPLRLAALRDRLLLDAAALLGAGADAERDYAAAGVPMLPVVRGERGDQAADPALDARDGRASACCRSPPARPACSTWSPPSRSAPSSWRSRPCWRRDPGIGWARATFHYSLLYLALIFVALVVDAA